MKDQQDEARYYRLMLNALAGLQDDLDANRAPDEAKELLSELLEVCRSEFRTRFPHER